MGGIHVKEITHRGHQCKALYFEYNQEVIRQVKKIPGIKWSQTKKCWYVPKETDISRYLAAIVRPAQKKGNEKKKEPPKPLDNKNEAAIVETIQWMRLRQYSLSTCDQYEKTMRRFFRVVNKSWNEIQIKDIVNYNYVTFIEGREKNRYSAQNIFTSAMKLFFKRQKSNLIIPENLERPRKGRRLPMVLSEQEVAALFRVTRNMKHRALLMLIYSAGLRIGETLKLKLTDINSERRVIEIHAGKGNKDRQVPLSERALELLREYYKAYRPRQYVFEGEREGRPYSPRSAQQVLQRSVRRAGIKKRTTLHTLRHSYATHLMERGVGLRYIQDILGHASPKTTMIYTHVSGKKLRDVVSPLDEMDL